MFFIYNNLDPSFHQLNQKHQSHARQDGDELDQGPGGFDIPMKPGNNQKRPD